MKVWRMALGAAGSMALLLALVVAFAAGAASGPVPAAQTRPDVDDSSHIMTDTVNMPPRRDNTLYESEIGAVSNGAGDYLFAGVTENGDARRTVLAFDLSGVPPWATVLSASLTLTMSKSIAGPADVSLHELVAGWGEGASDALGEEGGGALAQPGDATWIYTFFNTDKWTTPGGDFEPAPSSATTVGAFGPYTWASAALLADVAGWTADPGSNFGWVLIGNEAGPGTAKRFNSRENATGGPRLTVTYAFEGYRVFVPGVVK